MKILKKAAAFAVIIGAFGVLYFSGVTRNVSEKAAEVISAVYGVKKSDAVNSEAVNIYVNDRKFDEEPAPKVFMTDKLVWMADAGTLSRIFGCEIERTDSHTALVKADGQTYCFSDGSPIVTTSGGDKLYDNAVLFDNDSVCLSIEAVSELLGASFLWNEDSHTIAITLPAAEARTLPTHFDLRNEGRVMPARSQGNLGTCWAFAALSAVESTMLPGQAHTFAADHMSLCNGFNISQNDGGDYNIALAYMASWKGPVNEADDPYGDNVTDEKLEAVCHLQEAVNIGSKDYEKIKMMIQDYGAVQSSFYSDIEVANADSEFYNAGTAGYFYSGSAKANHDVIIIGWDDNYPKENFHTPPKNDGAFICQNSWGQSFGDDGCFYISYEDTNIGMNNMVYTKIEPSDNYDAIYQTDNLGWIGAIGYNEPFAYFGNKYHAEDTEALKAVSFYATGADTTYEVYVVNENVSADNLSNMRFLKSGVIDEAGYYTVPLSGNITVSGDFAVIVKIITKDAVHPVAIEYSGENNEFDADISDGEGYISYNGKYWQRAEDNYSCNICLKAFINKID